jgi:hypothetical protein
VDASKSAQLDALVVSASLPFADVRWLALGFFIAPDGLMESQSVWFCMKNKDYPSPVDPPIDY